MAKDYFQDITPPDPSSTPPSREDTPPSENPPAPPVPPADIPPRPGIGETPERTIRNIQVSRSRGRFGEGERREGAPRPPKNPSSRLWMWGAVGLALIVLGAIALVAFRPTTITIIPRSHTILFDETATFTAYPIGLTATGTLTFVVETSSFEDSQVVPTEGVENVSERASGVITVYNDYSTQSVKLIENTRFETPDGLIFRTPTEVVIPGRRGGTPGEIRITVFADEPGQEYNVGPIERWSVPGLRSNRDMYASIYAGSASAMTGGFVGERPAAAPGAIEGVQAEIRSRLQEKVREMARTRTDADTFVFADLAHVTFESLPQTEEAGEGVRIFERARVELPVFPATTFAHIVAESVSAGAESGGVTLRPGDTLSARAFGSQSSSLESTPLQFSLAGTAQLVWNVDTIELAEALAGRDEAAFQAIVETFPGIEEAHARIEPFWKNSFPNNPGAIKIQVEEPEPAA